MGRIGVDEGAVEFRHGVDQLVLGVMSDAMSVAEADRRVDIEFCVGVQAVADPAHLDAMHALHTRLGR